LTTYYKNKVTAYIGIACCIGLFYLSLPRFIAAVYMFYPVQVDKTVTSVRNANDLKLYQKSNEHIKSALQWAATGERWQMLGTNNIQLFSVVEATLQKPAIKEIYADMVHSLTISPVNTYVWYRLAFMQKILNFSIEDQLHSMRLSCYADRLEINLLIKRIRFFHKHQAFLDPELQDIFKDQIYLASTLRFRALVELIKQQPDLFEVVEQVLTYEPERWQKLLRYYQRITRSKT